MNLYNQHYLYLLLLLIPIIYGLLRWNRRLKSRFHSFAEDHFFAYYLGQRSQFFSVLKLSLLILALVRIASTRTLACRNHRRCAVAPPDHNGSSHAGLADMPAPEAQASKASYSV